MLINKYLKQTNVQLVQVETILMIYYQYWSPLKLSKKVGVLVTPSRLHYSMQPMTIGVT